MIATHVFSLWELHLSSSSDFFVLGCLSDDPLPWFPGSVTLFQVVLLEERDDKLVGRDEYSTGWCPFADTWHCAYYESNTKSSQNYHQISNFFQILWPLTASPMYACCKLLGLNNSQAIFFMKLVIISYWQEIVISMTAFSLSRLSHDKMTSHSDAKL